MQFSIKRYCGQKRALALEQKQTEVIPIDVVIGAAGTDEASWRNHLQWTEEIVGCRRGNLQCLKVSWRSVSLEHREKE